MLKKHCRHKQVQILPSPNMSSRFGPDPADESFFSQSELHEEPPMMMRADLPVAQILREDSAEEEVMTQASAEEPFQDSIPNRHPLVQTPLCADQWCMINQTQHMRTMITSMETIILRQRFTVAHYLVLMRWQHDHLGHSVGHPDTQMWLEANNILRGYAHDHAIIISFSRITSRARSRSRS